MAPVPGGHDPLVVTPEQAVADVRSGHRVFVQGIAATPTLLTAALAEHGKQVHCLKTYLVPGSVICVFVSADVVLVIS